MAALVQISNNIRFAVILSNNTITYQITPSNQPTSCSLWSVSSNA